MSLRQIMLKSPEMQGTDVKSWQRLVQDRGYMPAEGSVDGFWGPKSDSALRGFQRDYGLEDDGIIGPITGERLVEGYTDYGSPLADPEKPQINPL